MKVSIIIPAYNAEKYIDKCLYQIVNQTINDFEVIIINDGSTDNTLKKLRKYEKKYKFIKVYSQSNVGQATTRNNAIELVKGEYITFIDVDDFIDTTFLEEMLEEAEKTKADIVYCDYYKYYGNSKLKLVKNDMHPILINPSSWGKLYKTSFIKKSNLKFLEGKIFEDIAIIPILLGIGKTSYIPLPLYYYNNENTSSIRLDIYNRKLEDLFESIDETIYNFKKHKIYTKYKKEIEFMYLNSFIKNGVLMFSNYNEGINNIRYVREKVLFYFPNILENEYYLNCSLKNKLIYKACLKMNPKMLIFIKRTFRRFRKC